jgi:hypothetical protein
MCIYACVYSCMHVYIHVCMHACVCIKVCEIHKPPPPHAHTHAHAHTHTPVGAHAVCRGGHGRGTTGVCEGRLGGVCKDGVGRGVVCHVGCGSSVLEGGGV